MFPTIPHDYPDLKPHCTKLNGNLVSSLVKGYTSNPASSDKLTKLLSALPISNDSGSFGKYIGCANISECINKLSFTNKSMTDLSTVLRIVLYLVSSKDMKSICNIADAERTIFGNNPIISELQTYSYTYMACEADRALNTQTSNCKSSNISDGSDLCFPSRNNKFNTHPILGRDITFDVAQLREVIGMDPVTTVNKRYSIVTNEFYAFLALWKVISGLYDHTCQENGNSTVDGYTLIETINMKYPDGMVLPQARILRRNCDIIFLVRGTLTKYEWHLNFIQWQVPMHSNSKTFVHYGFYSLAQSMYHALADVIRSMVEDDCGQLEILLSGHSLGAAVSNILALLIADEFSNVNLTFVGFATPRAVSTYSNSITSRYLIDIKDSLYEVPCNTQNSKHTWPRLLTPNLLPNGIGGDSFPYPPNEIVLDGELTLNYLVIDSLFTTRSEAPLPSTAILNRILNSDLRKYHLDVYNCVLSHGCRANSSSLFNWNCASK